MICGGRSFAERKLHVICPTVGATDSRVVTALECAADRAGAALYFHALDPGVDRDYFDLLSAYWRSGETFCIVEHDIVVRPEALVEFEECPERWCAAPYRYVGSTHYGLGCVRFDGSLLAAHPDVMDRVAVMCDPSHPPRHWCRLDAWISAVLYDRGERRDGHAGMVEHLNQGVSHGCYTAAA